MIAGLPWSAWLLLAAAVGVGLALVLTFWVAHRRLPRPPDPLDRTSD